MSNNKHFADLLKVCSILPALAIMPAMAEVVEKTGAVDSPVDYVTNQRTDEMGRDGDPMGLLRVLNMTAGSFSHDLDTNTLVVAPDTNGKITAQNLFVGIQSNTDADMVPSMVVKGNENTVLTLSSGKNGVYPLLSRFAGLNIGTEDAPLGEVNLIHTGAAEDENTAIYVTGGNSNVHADSQELNIFANKVSIKSNAAAITGNEGRLDLVANESLDIVGGIYGYNEVYGGKSNLIFNINQNEGNIAKTTIRGNINAAKGSEVNIGLNGAESSIVGNLLVSAEGTKLPGGLINLNFGDEGTITGNITAQDEGVIKITAGDDFEINGNVSAKTEGSLIDIQGTDIEIEANTNGLLASNGATINVGTKVAKEIEILSESGRPLRADNGSVLNVGNVDTESVDISTDNNYAIMAVHADTVVDIKGKNIDVSTSGNNYMAAYAGYAGTLNIGTEDTENINLSATDYSAVQVLQDESKMDITGKNIVISNNANTWGAVHAGNASIKADNDYDKSATLDIKGENIFIKNSAEKGIGVTALSQGVVNIEGNTTIRAQKAIAARGEAKVNINKSGEHVVKIDGDMHFNYDKATSGSKVDAFVDVTLAGADSYWTGNTVVSYGSGKPADMSYFEVGSAKLTLKDGAIWNAKKIVDYGDETSGVMYAALNDLVIDGGTVNIADTERGITIDRIVANDATFTGGMLNVNESIDIESGETLFNGNVTGAKGAELTLNSGATMDIGTSTIRFDTMTINGTVIASVTNGRPYGRLYGDITAGGDALLKLNVGSVGTYKIFNDEDVNMKIDAGLAYVVTSNGSDGIVVETKSIETLAEDAGISTQAAGVVAGLANSHDSTLQKVSLAAQQALNAGDKALVEQEAKKLNPEEKPVVQALASAVQNQVLSLASGRMSGGAVIGRAGGDSSQENGFWMHGVFNKSKLDGQFHGYTRGVAFGMDTVIDNKYILGGGLAFNNSDVHSNGRGHTDIDSKTLFLYGQYKPNNWFANMTLTYNMSEYDETKSVFGYNINNVYDVDSYGAQIMGGYDFNTGITTEAGLRYLHIDQDAYADISATNTDFLTSVAGIKYAFAIENDWAIELRPELRAALTYDIISEADAATIDMPGVASYQVKGENLDRLGGEFGIGLTADYKGLKVTLMYDLDLHKDYTSQTGMIKFRTQF